MIADFQLLPKFREIDSKEVFIAFNAFFAVEAELLTSF